MLFNQTWVIDASKETLDVNEAKSHKPKSKVIRGQVVKEAKNIKFDPIKNLIKSSWNHVTPTGVGLLTCI